MINTIDKIMFDFKLTISLIKIYDELEINWENMDDNSRSIYNSKSEYIEVSLRAFIQSFYINSELEKTLK